MGLAVLSTALGILAKDEFAPPPWYPWASTVFLLIVVAGWVIWTCVELLKIRRPSKIRAQA
jgi:hypothetical protein